MIHFAQYGLLLILSAFFVFHILVLLKIIPYNRVWGGRLKTDKEMYRLEIGSALVILFFLFIVLVHSGMLAINIPNKTMTIVLWTMTVLFAFNTLGNGISKNKTEQRLFTPITLILAILSLILALSN